MVYLPGRRHARCIMLELSVLNDLRPLARGAHFIVSACAGLAVYSLISRMSPDTPTNLLSKLSQWAFSLSAACTAHYVLDVVFRVP